MSEFTQIKTDPVLESVPFENIEKNPVRSLTHLKQRVQTSARDYVWSEKPEPHAERRKQILKAHPEVRKLFGPDPTTALWMTAIIFLQFGLAYALRAQSFWLNLLLAYSVGALANHALFVVIHECAHNLVFRGTRLNRLCGIAANFPILFPGAMGFRKYHLIHHKHQGELDRDADLAGPLEAAWVGNSRFKKALWFLGFFVVEGILRPARLKDVKLWDRWVVLNGIIQISLMGAVLGFWGSWAFIYLALSSVFSIGLHPVGARWIQEHYLFAEGQETYSYYGPMNWLCFNVGYHNEHHDLMTVAWSRLPDLRRMAAEFYDPLWHHSSWTSLIIHFIFGKDTLFQRVVRREQGQTDFDSAV